MYGWDYWIIFSNLLDIALELLQHGLLGLVVFCLVFPLTSTIQFVAFWVVGHGRRYKVSTDVVYGIVISSLLLAFSVGLVSHFFLDGLYNTPLSPPLDLDIPPHLQNGGTQW